MNKSRRPDSKSVPNLRRATTRRRRTRDERVAEVIVSGVEMNAVTARSYSTLLGDVDIAECVAVMIGATQRVTDGNLAALEAMLTAQAVTLNAMFTQLAYQTSKMTIVDQIDRFTRLALKAQSQCRATIETLAMMKHPPVLFAGQANIAHGLQQVNNGGSRAALPETQPIQQQLEAPRERMDSRTACTAGTGDQELAPVGTCHRASNRRR